MAYARPRLQAGGAQFGHRSSTSTAVSVSVFMELGVADTLPTLNAPAISCQL